LYIFLRSFRIVFATFSTKRLRRVVLLIVKLRRSWLDMGLTYGKAKIGSFPPFHLSVHRLGPFCPGSSGRDGEVECRCEDEEKVDRELLGRDNKEGTRAAMEEGGKAAAVGEVLVLAGCDGALEDNEIRRGAHLWLEGERNHR
jgi:hypothetical protein